MAVAKKEYVSKKNLSAKVANFNYWGLFMEREDNEIKREIFFDDLSKIYRLVEEREDRVNSIYNILKLPILANGDMDIFGEKSESLFGISSIRELILSLNLEPKKDNIVALCSRIISLREDSILQILKRVGKDREGIVEARKIALHIVKDFHMNEHVKILKKIEDENMLTPFYREIISGIHRIGEGINRLFFRWQFELIDGFNVEIENTLGEERAFLVLGDSIDIVDGERADRSYSIPVLDSSGKYIALPYSQAFDSEIKEIVSECKNLLSKIEPLKDDIFDKKESYFKYFLALECAFGEKDRNKLIERWRDVDRRWMEIDTPIQIGHPLEYYEDKFRHCVAPEWDLRICKIDKNKAEKNSFDVKNIDQKNSLRDSIKNTFSTISEKLGAEIDLVDFCLNSLNKVSLYNSTPALFYGSELNGLFSAQVVPNDEIISKQYGKKIFAFPDRILRSSRTKPDMRLTYETFPKWFIDEWKEILFFKEDLWYKVYDITTNGHEFGHILWIDENTEKSMNGDGNFKNIEEFKATSGGLVSFFYSLDKNCDNAIFDVVMNDVLKRAVNLLAWRENIEVVPYYCEGIIHLSGAFECGVLEYEGKFGAYLENKISAISINKDRYKLLKDWYMDRYETLAKHYIEKRCAGDWLGEFAIKNDGFFYPKNSKARAFGDDYWERYKQIGQEVLIL